MNSSKDESVQLSLIKVANLDVEGLLSARDEYGDSWKENGGIGAYFTLKRPLDRLVKLCSKMPKGGDGRYDIFAHCVESEGDGGALNAVRDLRRYLTLVEAELIERGEKLPVQRHNAMAEHKRRTGTWKWQDVKLCTEDHDTSTTVSS